MDSDKTVSVDKFPTICRICLSTSDLLPLISIDIRNVFNNITNIKVLDDDMLPKNICKNCLKRLEDISQFIEQCIVNHSVLLKALDQEQSDDKLPEDCTDIDYNYDNVINNEISIKHVKQNDVTVFQCNICDMTFTKKKLLTQHVKQHIDQKIAVNIDANDEADKTLKRQSVINLKCEMCGKLFGTKTALVKHNKLHKKRKKESQAKNMTYNCDECDRVLTSIYALESHKKTHTGERPYKCDHCEKDFPYLGSLIIHTRLHTGETPYICSICNKGYRSSTSLKKHKEKHVVEEGIVEDGDQNVSKHLQTVKCSFCNKILSKHGYGTHLRTHTNSKKIFCCTVCNKMFQKHSHLQRHVRIHTGERPYVCRVCSKAFVQNGDLKRHSLTHCGQREFQCQYCGKQFFTKCSLTTHILHHCNVSKKSREDDQKLHINNVKPQINERPFLCTICGKSFTANSSLKVHHRLHTGENPFVCNICNKAYNNSSALKRHIIRYHTEEKHHVCMICQKGFHDPASLKRHIKLVHSVLEIKNGNKSETYNSK